jgi:glycosyltransferase involved in cell wall biosynthesis
MKLKIQVSIVIPCYNSEKFIGRTIDSVLHQSLTEFEIIIVNDGSTDSSRKIIETINDSRVCIINTKNNGVSKARNIGLQEAKGKYILFLDSDDLLPNNYLMHSVETLSDDTYDFCTFPVIHINENDEIIKNNLNLNLTGAYENVQFQIANFSKNVSACPSAYVYIRKSLLNCGLHFNEKLQSPEDRFFLLEVGRYLKGCLIEDCKLMYRVSGSSLSNKKNIRLVKMQETYLNKVIETELIESKNIRAVFIRKMSYQLFVDYLRFHKYLKSLFFIKKYVITFFR